MEFVCFRKRGTCYVVWEDDQCVYLCIALELFINRSVSLLRNPASIRCWPKFHKLPPWFQFLLRTSLKNFGQLRTSWICKINRTVKSQIEVVFSRKADQGGVCSWSNQPQTFNGWYLTLIATWTVCSICDHNLQTCLRNSAQITHKNDSHWWTPLFT
jgi:hypothetical protein